MALRFNEAIDESNDRFLNLILPYLQKNSDIFKNANVLCLENTDNKFKNKLDMTSGLDYILVNNYGIQGLATRIQNTCPKTDSPYNTFTIRYKRESGAMTEFEKRKYQINNEYIYPKYTIQSYINKNGEISSVAIAKTKELIEFCSRGYAPKKPTGIDQFGQAWFYIVEWQRYKNFENYVDIF